MTADGKTASIIIVRSHEKKQDPNKETPFSNHGGDIFIYSWNDNYMNGSYTLKFGSSFNLKEEANPATKSVITSPVFFFLGLPACQLSKDITSTCLTENKKSPAESG